MSEQIIVFGIFFDERAKKEYGSMKNLVRHTFTTHFDDYNDPNKYRGPEIDTGEFGGPGRAGKQVIAKDPDVTLFWRNYRPDEVKSQDPKEPSKEELFLNVAMDRFITDNRQLYRSVPYMTILTHFKNHMIDMIRERDEREGKIQRTAKRGQEKDSNRCGNGTNKGATTGKS